jgi:hypothetical protein
MTIQTQFDLFIAADIEGTCSFGLDYPEVTLFQFSGLDRLEGGSTTISSYSDSDGDSSIESSECECLLDNLQVPLATEIQKRGRPTQSRLQARRVEEDDDDQGSVDLTRSRGVRRHQRRTEPLEEDSLRLTRTRISSNNVRGRGGGQEQQDAKEGEMGSSEDELYFDMIIPLSSS